jgi:penicillin-binding protein 1A
MSKNTAVELIDMMRGAVTRGTGQMVKTQFGIFADIAGKTGTTQNNTDGWFILMHPNLVAGAWVGFNDSRVTMRSDYWGQGGHNALMVVGDFFKDTLKAKLLDTKAQFPRPKRAAPLMVQAPQQDMAVPAQLLPDGHGVVTGRNGETYVIGPDRVRKHEAQQGAHIAGSDVDRHMASGASDGRGASMAGGQSGRPPADSIEAIWNSTR